MARPVRFELTTSGFEGRRPLSGKTFLACALGHIACRHGYNVKFAGADETLKRLRQSRFDDSRHAEMLALTTVDLLIVDDFALEPMSKEESKDYTVGQPSRELTAVTVIREDCRAVPVRVSMPGGSTAQISIDDGAPLVADGLVVKVPPR